MKRAVKHLVGQALFASGVSTLLIREAAIVVAFHRVRPVARGDCLTTPVRQFEAWCRFFKRCFDVVRLDELVERMRSGRPIRGLLAITFDDGYRDNYTYAAPILETLGLPATFFVVTRWIGTETVAWWDRSQPPAKNQWMSWNEIQSLHSRAFEIGAHTQTHVDLGVVSADDARREISGVQRDLERHLGAAPRSFAYPYGRRANITELNRDVVRESGFRCCCSAFGGVNRPATDPFRLLRVPIDCESVTPQGFGFEVVFNRTLHAV